MCGQALDTGRALFSSAVGTNGRVIGLVPEEIAGFKSDPVGTLQRVAQELGRSNIDTLVLPLAKAPSVSLSEHVRSCVGVRELPTIFIAPPCGGRTSWDLTAAYFNN